MKKDGFSEIYDIYFPKLLRFTQDVSDFGR